MNNQLVEAVRNEVRKAYPQWKKGGHDEWVALDIISEMFESHDDFDSISITAIQEEVRKEIESL